MHKVTFYPLGNADCSLIELDNGKNFLFDYSHCRDESDDNDLRIDLKNSILEKMEDKEKDFFDVVTFTHADDDHIKGFSDIFYLEHSSKYQDEDRLKINELWVPASVIIEKDLENDAEILQKEARYRLKNKSNIKIFSRPSMLKDWFKNNGLDINEYKELMIDAGQIVPNFNYTDDSIEIFVHSPFAKREEDELIDRNLCSIVVQITFMSSKEYTRVILSADTPHENWKEIVEITRGKDREEKLSWDIFKIPHHCSYKSLSDEKGDKKTEPIEEVQWLFNQGQEKCTIISTSKVIEDEDSDQPPHYQAKNFYKEIATDKDGEFIVTMEHPKPSKPEPLEIEIDETGTTILKRNLGAVGVLTSRPAPRAGD
ncbi:MAG: hypothetical protein M5R37_09775 [Melioribacteraceae bacterium]|nr:hypothetical protein [Melioribacteraceae bacterium]